MNLLVCLDIIRICLWCTKAKTNLITCLRIRSRIRFLCRRRLTSNLNLVFSSNWFLTHSFIRNNANQVNFNWISRYKIERNWIHHRISLNSLQNLNWIKIWITIKNFHRYCLIWPSSVLQNLNKILAILIEKLVCLAYTIQYYTKAVKTLKFVLSLQKCIKGMSAHSAYIKFITNEKQSHVLFGWNMVKIQVKKSRRLDGKKEGKTINVFFIIYKFCFLLYDKMNLLRRLQDFNLLFLWCNRWLFVLGTRKYVIYSGVC